MQTLTNVTLASASPRRLELLRSLGLSVNVVVSDYHEADDPNATPIELAQRHALGKLHAIHAEGVAVAADTVVDVDGVALGKPLDAADAARMLRLLSGRTHLVHTAFALRANGRVTQRRSTTAVTFYHLEEREIDDYLATGEPMDKAGAYGIQGRAAALVERVDGDFYTVMGFPLGCFIRAIQSLGFNLPIV